MRDKTRRAMRRRREALDTAERRRAARSVCKRVNSARLLRPGMRVGVYLTVRGELDTAPIIALARRRGCHVYVPIVRSHRGGTMWFVPLTGTLRSGRFGIAEPTTGRHRRVSPRWLDLVFVPLLAFGAAGERLGSGAGYYDRAFAHLRARRDWCKPLLVGLAYDWQRVADLPVEAWDVPLAAVITDAGMHIFTSSPLNPRRRR